MLKQEKHKASGGGKEPAVGPGEGSTRVRDWCEEGQHVFRI